MDDVASSHEPILIAGKRTNAILLSEQDWASIQESLFLLEVPGMRESIAAEIKVPVEACAKELDW
jgi:antitoxin YefM